MSAEWFGVAQSARTNVRRTHGQRSLSRVSGTTNIIRAIYGSTDHARDDHRNDALCVVVDDAKHCYTNDPTLSVPAYKPSYGNYVGRYSEYQNTFSPHIAPQAQENKPSIELESLLIRARHYNMTLVEYCAKIGVQL